MANFPDKSGIVYSLTFPDNKKYIGITTIGLHKRMINHACNPSKTSKISNVIKEVGIDSIKVETLDTFLNKEDAFKLEQKYIKENNSVENGYNTALGGLGTTGVIPNDQIRKKMSESQIKRFNNPGERERVGVNTTNWINNNPEKHKEIVKKRIQTLSTDEYRKKASIIRKQLAIDNPEIGKNHTAFMLERYKNNPDLRKQVSIQKGGRPVEVYKDGIKVADYDMVADCAKELKLSTGNIAMVLAGKRNHTKGYTFKRKNEE